MAEWDTGLLECFDDCDVCYVSTFCPICQVAYQRASVSESAVSWRDYLYATVCPIWSCVVTRSEIRGKYGIKGSLFSDLVAILCCSFCGLAQQTRQLYLRGQTPAGMWMEDERFQTFR
eukprot:TRINITY_DN2950_c0_g2_i2.p1 TRINITY_DN2950_c0_g2~~TRINITY_DN2950_c0_g2_i2.p1  ORF type:complete len:118 (+),score=4.34 TRINITY_DN2950_c0_g2_i2:225-578(+)